MNKKTIIGIVIAVILVLAIGGVYLLSTNKSNKNNSNTSQKIANTNVSNNNEVSNTENNNSNENIQSQGQKSLVVYFSVPETDSPNNMTRDEDNSTVVVNGEVLGNTQYVAQVIREKTNADIFRLEPTNAYPTNHQELLERAREEMDRDAKPEIKGEIANFEDYDVIFLGYPIWNAEVPPIINTFLEKYNFDGKTVVPFCTHGGSGLSGTPSTIANKLKNSIVITNGLSLSRTNMDNTISAVESWLSEIYE